MTAARQLHPAKGSPGGDDYHELWIDPRDPERQILGTDQGAVVTLNGGRTWSSWYNQPTAQIYHVATDNRFPYWVYGAQQDSGGAARAQPHDRHRRHQPHALPRDHRRRRERQHRARPARTPTSSTAGRSSGSTCARGRPSRSTRRSPSRASTVTRGRCRSAFSRRDPRVLYFAQPEALPHRGRRRALDRDQPRPDPRGPRRARDPRSRDGRSPPRAPGRGAASSTRSRRRASPTATSGSAPTTAWSGAPATRGALAGRHARRAHALVEGRHPRGLAVRRRDRLRGRRPPPPRRLPPLHLPDARRRPELDARRATGSRRTTRSTSCARIRCGAACSTRAPSAAST